MKIDFKKNNSNKEITTLKNGDAVIIKSNLDSSISTLIYFVDIGGSGEDLWKLFYLDELTTMEMDSLLALEFDDEYKMVKHFVEEELDCKIVEIIPSEELELRRI